MDNEFVKKIFLIVAVLIAALVFYFVASPLKNCLREEISGNQVAWCYHEAKW